MIPDQEEKFEAVYKSLTEKATEQLLFNTFLKMYPGESPSASHHEALDSSSRLEIWGQDIHGEHTGSHKLMRHHSVIAASTASSPVLR